MSQVYTQISMHVQDASGNPLQGAMLSLNVMLPVGFPYTWSDYTDASGNVTISFSNDQTLQSWSVQLSGYTTQSANGIPPSTVTLQTISGTPPPPTPPPPTLYSLNVSVEGNGTISPAPGQYSASSGTYVFKQSPSSGWQFSYWILDGQDIATSTISVPMNADHTLVAVFTAIPTVTPPPPTPTPPVTAGPSKITVPVVIGLAAAAALTIGIVAYKKRRR